VTELAPLKDPPARLQRARLCIPIEPAVAVGDACMMNGCGSVRVVTPVWLAPLGKAGYRVIQGKAIRRQAGELATTANVPDVAFVVNAGAVTVPSDAVVL